MVHDIKAATQTHALNPGEYVQRLYGARHQGVRTDLQFIKPKHTEYENVMLYCSIMAVNKDESQNE